MKSPGFRIVLASALAAALMTVGCGGPPSLRVDFATDPGNEQPVWVGVFYLSLAEALDGESNSDLIVDPGAYEGAPGVVGLPKVFSVHPGDDPKVVKLEDYSDDIGWLLIVADSPENCARHKFEVEAGSSIHIRAVVDDACIKVKR